MIFLIQHKQFLFFKNLQNLNSRIKKIKKNPARPKIINLQFLEVYFSYST